MLSAPSALRGVTDETYSESATRDLDIVSAHKCVSLLSGWPILRAWALRYPAQLGDDFYPIASARELDPVAAHLHADGMGATRGLRHRLGICQSATMTVGGVTRCIAKVLLDRD